MKKTLVSALTTALVVGAASTTFAAANPFSDVPADHWAYDAVQQLAQDGVVEGYGDGTFRGQQNITRYEMAQMIAKAMAKADTSAADKALLDKLAAEFSDELKNLGVRVSNLESKVDNVKWDGFVRYDFTKRNIEGINNNFGTKEDDDLGRVDTAQRIVLRLNTSMEINDNWTGHARIEHYMSANSGMSNSVGVNQNGRQENFTRINRAYAEGKYGTTSIKLGRFGSFDNATHGLESDANITGAEVTFGAGKNVKVQLTAGRGSWAAENIFDTTNDINQVNGCPDYSRSTFTYLAGEVVYNNGKLDAGVGARVWKSHTFASRFSADGDSFSKLGAWNVGMGYRFDKNVRLILDYAHSMGFDAGKLSNGETLSNGKKAGFNKGNHSYSIQLNYKGADVSKRGTYGLFLAYRKVANAVSPSVTYDDGMYDSQKGWAVGGTYVFTKNVTGYVDYFWGKNFNTGKKQNRIVGQLNFFF